MLHQLPPPEVAPSTLLARILPLPRVRRPDVLLQHARIEEAAVAVLADVTAIVLPVRLDVRLQVLLRVEQLGTLRALDGLLHRVDDAVLLHVIGGRVALPANVAGHGNSLHVRLFVVLVGLRGL